MTSLTAPRYELPIIDPSNGRMSREWYRFLVQLAKAVDASPTLSDDLQSIENTDIGAVEGIALTALRTAQMTVGLTLMDYDMPKPIDLSLLSWWPGEIK